MGITTLHTTAGTFRIALQGPAQAPVLVLSNSLGTTLEMWDAQATALAVDWRVLRYDTRGHGGSITGPGPYSLAQLSQDVLAILDALHMVQAHFCGISMGGLTGLWLGIHAPARMRSLTIANSAAKIGHASAWQERAALVRTQGPSAMQALAASAPSRWFSGHFAASHPALVQTAQEWIAGIAPEGYASCCEALSKADLRSTISAIRSPTLLMAGVYDPVTTLADAQAMHAAIPGSVLATVPASHLSNLEAPTAFEQTLQDFLHLH